MGVGNRVSLDRPRYGLGLLRLLEQRGLTLRLRCSPKMILFQDTTDKQTDQIKQCLLNSKWLISFPDLWQASPIPIYPVSSA